MCFRGQHMLIWVWQATSPRFQTTELPEVWPARKCFQVLMLSMRLIIINLQFYSWYSGISRGQPTFFCCPCQPASYRVSAKQKTHEILKARHILNTKSSSIFQPAPSYLNRQHWWLQFIESALEKLLQWRLKEFADEGGRDTCYCIFCSLKWSTRTMSLFQCSAEMKAQKIRAETCPTYQD